jgi:neuropeptide Y receptor
MGLWNCSSTLATLPERTLDLGEATNDDLNNRESQNNITAFLRNVSWLLNATIDQQMLKEYARNRVVEDPTYSILILLYSVLIIVGVAGNSLVVLAVVRKPAMRTARNMFIVNLAVSDLLLCLITMPLTLVEILAKYWPLGTFPFVCKILGTLQAISIFVSTISITAIALDRYQVIVYPARKGLQKVGAVIVLGCIWLVAIVLASPLYYFRTLKHHEINIPSLGLDYVAYCLEEWPVEHGRAYYSLFALIVQYVVPIITVSVAYCRICRKLKYRYANSLAVASSSNYRSCGMSANRRMPNTNRMKRTNLLFVAIGLIFCISWLPLNVFNLVVDFWNPFGEDRHSMIIWYAVCHMMGMSSACSNPLLYGWFNENFLREFKEIMASVCLCVLVDAVRKRMRSFRSSSSNGRRKMEGTESAEGGLGERDQDEPVIDAGAVSNYMRGTETMTTANGLQGDMEMTILIESEEETRQR